MTRIFASAYIRTSAYGLCAPEALFTRVSKSAMNRRNLG